MLKSTTAGSSSGLDHAVGLPRVGRWRLAAHRVRVLAIAQEPLSRLSPAWTLVGAFYRWCPIDLLPIRKADRKSSRSRHPADAAHTHAQREPTENPPRNCLGSGRKQKNGQRPGQGKQRARIRLIARFNGHHATGRWAGARRGEGAPALLEAPFFCEKAKRFPSVWLLLVRDGPPSARDRWTDLCKRPEAGARRLPAGGSMPEEPKQRVRASPIFCATVAWRFFACEAQPELV